MNKQVFGVLTIAAAVGFTTVQVLPASADLTTRCVGQGGAVTVPGDLVVPRGRSCTLTGTTVTGDVRVGRGADLIAQDSTVDGRVVGGQDAYVEATSSTIGGTVDLRGAYGGYLERTQAGGRVLTRPGGDSLSGGFVYTVGTDVAADLVSHNGEVFVESSEISGNLQSNASAYTDVYESFVDGRMTVRDNELGSVVCASAVQGEARFLGNADIVQLGSDGPVADCAGPGSYFGGDVVVDGTTGGVFADNEIVNGDLTLRNNDPVARVGPQSSVRGRTLGEYEYEDWNGSSDGAKRRGRPSALPEGTTPRATTLDRKVERRHTTAVENAEHAGAAGIGR